MVSWNPAWLIFTVDTNEGGPMSVLFAATFPERVHSLTLYGASAASTPTDDYPWASTHEEHVAMRLLIEQYWGSGLCLGAMFPVGEVTEENMEDFGAAEMACGQSARCAAGNACLRRWKLSGK